MRFIIAVLVVAAMYGAYRHLILGVPVNPEKTLSEWSMQLKAETPKKISESLTLRTVRFDWDESTLASKGRKLWQEWYVVEGPAEKSTLTLTKDEIINRLCHDERYQIIMRLMKIEIHIQTHQEGDGIIRKQYPLEDTLRVSDAICIGR